MRFPELTKVTIACALALGALSGCAGGEPASVPDVATVARPSSSADTAGPAGAPQVAPVIRPDTTSAEVSRMQQPMMRCYQQQGLPMKKTEDGLLDLDAKGNSPLTNGRLLAQDPEVEKACGKLRPVYAPELDEAKNPYWADDDDNYHRCRAEHGEPLVKRDGEWERGPGWDDWAPDEAADLACQAAAFDGKRG